MIETILIANRGEIACRIIRACHALGLRAVAVYSDADAQAKHVQLADTAVSLGPAPAPDSYLHINKLIAAAQRTGADAVHPGYGFLAENAEFARACADAGLIFIGPTPEAMAAMGNKRAAKALAVQAGVPVIPGYSGPDQTDGRFRQEAAAIGYPVMVKAAAGGGGKGMRLVHEADALPAALATARREAMQAFGSDELLLERALLRPRHIEIQLLGDTHGSLIHLGERECSIQRRHQKIIEESPSTAVSADLRAQMGAAAIAVARAVNYHSAGTVEFLLDADGRFYFLEMNTRLQVEHPITELRCGLDLVAWQIRIAEGERLPLAQSDVTLTGHAIEARLYAENPANAFLPVTGVVQLWQPPTGAGVRVDAGLQTGDAIPVHYDPLLAKVSAHGPDRKTAVRRLRRALASLSLLGFTHNLPFLQDVLAHPAFVAGETPIDFVAQQLPDWQPPAGDVALAVTAVSLYRLAQQPHHWRNNPNQPLHHAYACGAETVDVRLTPASAGGDVRVQVNDAEPAPARLAQADLPALALLRDGVRTRIIAVADGDQWWVQTPTGVVACRALPRLPEPLRRADAAGSLRAPLPGLVTAVLVQVGDAVQPGQPLLKLEAMKMEHTIRTEAAGMVTAVFYDVGDAVDADAQLLRIEDA